MADGVGTTHHVKINGQYYLIRPGTYRKRPAPLFGSRFTTGDPDYNNLTFWQHWVQSCWIGGFGAETWQDDAMFHQGVGIDASQHEVMVISRDMGPTSSRDASGNWDLTQADNPRQREFGIFNDILWCLSVGDADATPPTRLFKWTGSTWSLVRSFTQHVITMEKFGGYLVFGDGGGTLTRMSSAESFTTFAKPGGITATPYMFRAYRGELYVGFDREIWRLKPNFTWNGSTAFYEAVGIDRFIQGDIHLNMLYMASSNGHILRTDGNNTFDLWQFDTGIKVESMRSFDGRLFVACVDPLDGTTAEEAVLFQFTGAAVTELKRWGKVGLDIGIGRMRVIGNRLMFGAASTLGMGDGVGFGVAAYDPVEDAYHMWSAHQGPGFPGGTENINYKVDDVIYFKGYVWATMRGEGIFRTKLSFEDVTRFQATYDTTKAGGSPGSKNGGWYESSDFDAGTPGLQKLWNAMTVHVDLPTTATSVYVEYSVDGGITWATLGSVVGDGVTTRYARVFYFGTGTPKVGVKSTRLKYRLTLRTTDSTRSPQLRGVIVRYLPIPDPTWQWDMQVVLSENQELLDGTSQELDASAIADKLSALETPFRQQVPVNFIDQDGTEWAPSGDVGVLVSSVVEDMPLPGPNSDGVRERIVSVQLIEAVESYA